MHYGQVIKQKRKAQAISLQALADILKIDRSLLCRYETGKRRVSKSHTPIIEKYLNGEHDEEILRLLLDGLQQKYAHLTGKRGLQLWM